MLLVLFLSFVCSARKSGRKGLSYVVPEEKRYDHTPHTQIYRVEEVMLDLLHTAAVSLRVGGVLAYVIPTPYDFDVTDLPWHPCLERTEVLYTCGRYTLLFW